MNNRTFDRPSERVARPVLVSAFSACLLLVSAPALAQESTAPGATGSAPTEAAPAPSAEPTTPAAPPPAAEAPAAAGTEEPAAAETSAAVGASTESSAALSLGGSATASETETEASVAATGSGSAPKAAATEEEGAAPKPPRLALELLPPSAFPNHPKPGIPGGSLSGSINHLQWPYMPKYEGEPELRLAFSGSSWVDSSYRSIKPGLQNEDDQTEYRMQGRLTLRATPVYNLEDDWFLQSNIEFAADTEQDIKVKTNYTDIDEAWIRFGKWKTFDVTVGRTQGFEVYHFGMGLDLNTFERSGAVSQQSEPAQPYGLSDLWDRGVGKGAVAVHWYLPDFVRLEFLTRFGVSANGTDIGIRPVGVFDLGWLKVKGGYERRVEATVFDSSNARKETQGLGASLQLVLDPWVEFGGGVGHRVRDDFEQDGAVRPGGSDTTLTYGGFLNARPFFEGWLVGVGYHRTEWENFQFDAFGEPENDTHQQMFGALQYILWDKLLIKYVLSYSHGHVEKRDDTDAADTGFANKSLSHRLRLAMSF